MVLVVSRAQVLSGGGWAETADGMGRLLADAVSRFESVAPVESATYLMLAQSHLAVRQF